MKRAAFLVSLTVTLSCAVFAADRPAPPGGFRIRSAQPPPRTMKDLPYVANGHQRQRLDLYLPPPASRTSPVIIWIHGGAWQEGDKADCPARYLVGRGYAVASLNYRFSQDAVFPAQLEDCQAAVRWLRMHSAEYGLDSTRFAAWGSSAGGHLAALLGTAGDSNPSLGVVSSNVSCSVQAVVDFFGPTDFIRMDEQLGSNGTLRHDAADSPESRLIGGPIQENKDKVARANPITYTSPGDPPVLLVHGRADTVVPWQQSQLLLDALQKAGVESSLHIVEGGGHGTGFGREVDVLVERFLASHLSNPSATEQPSGP